MLEKVLSEGW